MRVKRFLQTLAFLTGAISAGGLVYGALVESNRLIVERRRLWLKRWPKKLDGYCIALLADFHLRDIYSEQLAARAVEAAIAESPDIFVIPGDVIAYHKPGIIPVVRRVLEPLRGKKVVFTTGNHEFENGDPMAVLDVVRELGFNVLRNQAWFDGQVTWVGIESAKVEMDNAKQALAQARELPKPRVVVWHEPDMVDQLPGEAALMLSGHSHGGQFIFPGGFTPMHTVLGENYVQGFFPDAPTPLYVSRGIGTTGPPSRFNCPPEVSILTLHHEPHS